MTYVLQTHQLSKSFKGKLSVSEVSMRIKQGEIYGSLGPNGAGKTTIMKMLTNLIKPTSGEIELFGERLSPTSYAMLGRIEYMGYYNRKAIDEALEPVQLRGIDGKPVKDFSLGMKQRLGITRAIATKPELLILDEPINGLDPVGIKEIRHLLSILSHEYGISILISSHLLAEIEQLADTIGVINHGQLIKEVSLEQVRESNAEYIEFQTNECQKAAYVLSHHLQIANIRVIGNRSIRVYDLSRSLDTASPNE